MGNFRDVAGPVLVRVRRARQHRNADAVKHLTEALINGPNPLIVHPAYVGTVRDPNKPDANADPVRRSTHLAPV